MNVEDLWRSGVEYSSVDIVRKLIIRDLKEV